MAEARRRSRPFRECALSLPCGLSVRGPYAG
jgi:hypothetical protein